MAVSLACVALGNATRNTWSHGSARWVNRRDLKRAGLLGNGGPYIGVWKQGNTQRYVRAGGSEHVLVTAPTGSGKSVGLVIPTLLSWTESVFVLDLKGELWALTSGWRKAHAGNKVLRFEPAAESGSCCFNPLDEVRIGTQHEVGDAQNISLLLVDPDGKGLNDHWSKTAQSLPVGCILYLCLEARKGGQFATLPGLDGMLASPGRKIEKLWEEMAAFPHQRDLHREKQRVVSLKMEMAHQWGVERDPLQQVRELADQKPTLARQAERLALNGQGDSPEDKEGPKGRADPQTAGAANGMEVSL